MSTSPNALPAHGAVDPKCRCCDSVIEYNSSGYRWGLCISCISAVNGFVSRRREQLQRRGLVKK